MSDQPRITVNEVLEAYRKTGLKAEPLCWFRIHGNCGCPQTALYIAETGAQPDNDTPHSAMAEAVRRWAGEKYGYDYAAGFRGGFDDPMSTLGIEDDYRRGKVDGRAVRSAIDAGELATMRHDFNITCGCPRCAALWDAMDDDEKNLWACDHLGVLDRRSTDDDEEFDHATRY